MANIHETAVIDNGAEIADDVTIGPYAVISGQAEVQQGTELGPHVSIEGKVKIGPDNKIGAGAIIGTEPQDWGYEGGNTGVEIGADNIIREYVTINRSTDEPDGVTKIGNKNMIMCYCHIAHDCRVGDDNALANGVTLAGHVSVGDHVMMGGLVPVHQFVRIGSYAMVGGISRINKDVLPYIRVSGNPANVYDLNVIGLKRNDFDADTRRVLKKCFTLIYRENHNTTQATELIKEQFGDIDEVEFLLQFIRDSERGILK